MKYVMFIVCDEGVPTAEDLAMLQHDLPGWAKEMDARGVQRYGRELDLPGTASTVRVRDGETLVTDGPFAEAKEFVAGFNLLACSDLDEAIEVAASCPIARVQPLEIRPFAEALPLTERASAFARNDDSAGTPYLLTMWMGTSPAAPFDDQAVRAQTGAWRRDLAARGLHVLGNELQDAGLATTVRVQDAQRLLSSGPAIGTEEFIAGLDVVSCAGRQQAIRLAATHPFARYHAVEVRPFYRE